MALVLKTSGSNPLQVRVLYPPHMQKFPFITKIKAVIDSANELKSSGEVIHQVFGELSISFDRLLTDSEIEKTEFNGVKKIERKKWVINDGERLNFIKELYVSEGRKLLDKVYHNQGEIRNFLIQIVLIICVTILLSGIFWGRGLTLNVNYLR